MAAGAPVLRMLPDDLLSHVFEQLSCRDEILNLGAICWQWLRALRLCATWQKAETVRIRCHGAYLRGTFLRVQLELSMRTGTQCTAPVTVLLERLPMWWAGWGAMEYHDEVRDVWWFARPEGLPPPRLGAQSYTVKLASAALWQGYGLRTRQYRLADYCSSTDLDFNNFGLMSGDAVGDAESMRTPNDDEWEHCNNLWETWCADQSFSEVLRDQFECTAGHHLLSRQADGSPPWLPTQGYLAPNDDAIVPLWMELGILYDLELDKFCLRFAIGTSAYGGANFGLESAEDFVFVVMTLLGHAPSATALCPAARRRQAAALRKWLHGQTLARVER